MEEKISVNFKSTNISDFGYIILNDIVLLIYCEDSDYNCKTKISNIVVDLFAKNFYEMQEYSIKYLENLVYKVEKEFDEYKAKDIDIKYSSCSFAVILSDFNTIIASYCGNVRLTILKDEKVYFQSKLDNVAQLLVDKNEITKEDMYNNNYRYSLTNALGGLNALSLNILKPLEIATGDKIIIQGIDSCIKDNYELRDNSAIITVNSTTTNSKIIKKFIPKREYLKFLITFLIFFSLTMFYIINNIRIKRYINRIDKINKDLVVYIKNIDVQNIKREISHLDRIYNDIDNSRTLFVSNKIDRKFTHGKNTNDKLKKEIEVIINIKNMINKSKELINKNEYILSNEGYIKAKDEYIKNNLDYEEIKNELEHGISMTSTLITAVNSEKLADEDFDNKKYSRALNVYLEVMKIYEKYNKTQYVNIVLNQKINFCKEEINKIESKTKDLLSQADLILSDDYDKAYELYSICLTNYELLNDSSGIDDIKSKLENLKNEKESTYKRAMNLKEEAMVFIKDKKYKSAIEALIDSNILLKKLANKQEINKNLEHIRQIKALLRTNKELKPVKIVQDDTSLITESINQSIKKGDEYMKNNDWNNAIIEYQRAISFSEKIKANPEIITQLKEKLSYAIKKSNTSWWSKWI